jgi:predicted Zn-dependent protease
MKKFFVILGLLIIIVLSFGYVFLKIQAQGAEDDYFNQHWRAKFAEVPWLRHILALHNDGDARADYLGNRYQKILMEVDVMENLEPNLSALGLLTKRIAEATGKPTTYLVSDRNLPFQKEETAEDLDKVVKRFRTYHDAGDLATLYLLYANQMANEPELLGKTYHEDGIVIFAGALENFTRDNPKTFANYEASTALHEFGHQIGLIHNQQPGCLMNEHAESSHVARENPEDVVVDFCILEKDEIVKSRK